MPVFDNPRARAHHLFSKPVGCTKSVAALIVSSGFLVGCGFSPVYGTSGSSVGPVSIVQIDGRAGYFLRQELDRYAALEKATSAPRTLTVKLTQTFDSAALGVDGLSARTNLTLKADYSITSANGGPPQAGTVTTSVGYESLDQAYGDVALQADAEERAAKQIADRIWADLRRQARPNR
jgi:LPS-assembly lipoprotein